jgi:hypothetical protein
MLSFSLLGALPTDAISLIAHQATFLPARQPLTPGMCSADGQFIWNGPDPGGYWSRLVAGQQCTSLSTVGPTVQTEPQGGIGPTLCYARGTHDIVECPPTDPNAPANVPKPVDSKPMKMIQVGPFTIPYQAQQFTIHWSTALPSDWQTFINKELAHDCDNCVVSSMKDASDIPYLKDFLGGGMPAQFNQDFVVGAKGTIHGQFTGQITVTPDTDLSSYNPIVLTQHPDTGEDFGIYMALGVQDLSRPYDAKTNPAVLQLLWRKVERTWYAAAWNWIKHIVAKIIEIGGELICGYVCTPDAVDKAVKAAMASKNPYAVAGAVIGSAIAVGNCTCPLPPLVPVVPPPASYTGWIIAGLVAVGVIGAVVYRQS